MRPSVSGIVVNRQLPQLAKLSGAQFLERVANLEAIRTMKVSVTMLIGEKGQMTQLEELHAAVHSEQLPIGLTGFQLASSWAPFVLELPLALHQWLAAHSLAEVRGQLINWMAALHAAQCCRFTMWRKLLPEIRQWASAHYSKYVPRQADELINVWEREYDNAQRLVGAVTPGVLINPFRNNERPFLDSADVQASYQFEVQVGYFRKDDWLFIVERNRAKLLNYYKSNLESGAWTEETIDRRLRNINSDKMDRMEADRTLWQAWRQHFTALSPVL